MKSLIYITALILAVILAIGGLSSLSGSLSDVVGTTAAAQGTTAAVTMGGTSGSSDPYGGIKVDDCLTVYEDARDFSQTSIPVDARGLALFRSGICKSYDTGEVTHQIYTGTASKSNGSVMLCVAFSGLQVGKTYFIQFDNDGILFSFNTFYYRFNSGEFTEFSLTPDEIGSVLCFEAKGTEFQLGVVLFPETPSSDTLNVYATDITENSTFALWEVAD